MRITSAASLPSPADTSWFVFANSSVLSGTRIDLLIIG